MATSPLGAAAIAGSQSLAGEVETMVSGQNESPFCTDVKTSRLLFRNPSHATQTRPVNSAAATGKRSVPGALVRRISGDMLPSALALRAYKSKLPDRCVE